MRKKLLVFSIILFLLFLIPNLCFADFTVSVENNSSVYISFFMYQEDSSENLTRILNEVIIPGLKFVGVGYKSGMYVFKLKELETGKWIFEKRILVSDKFHDISLVVENLMIPRSLPSVGI